MLDTIRVKYPISPDKEELQYWMCKTITTTRGTRVSYIYNPIITEDKVMLKYTYIPFDYTGKPILTLEFSLPKLLYGNNHQMIGSIDGTIKLANMYLSMVPNAPILDLAEGILIRVDMCYNHQVGEAVDDYIRSLQYLDYPHRKTRYLKNEGVEFKAKHIFTKFYNKQKESGRVEAFGILRQESTLLEPKDIQKIFKARKPTLLNVSRDIVMDYLNDDLKKLSLLDNSIGTHDTTLNTLSTSLGPYAGPYYYALLKEKMGKSRKEIARETNTHPRSLDRRIRKIVEAHVPLTITETKEPLTPLHVNL